MLLKSVLLLLIVSLVLLNESNAKRSGGRSRISATLINRNNKKRKGSSGRNKSKESLQKEIGATGVAVPKQKIDDKNVKPLGFDNVNKPSAPVNNNQKPIGWNVPDNTNTKTVQKPLNAAQPPPYGANGNPPPYSAGTHQGNPPPYSAGTHQGNPPPYGAGTHQGNPPPYGAGSQGNPPPYGSNGNPPPYNNNPNHHGNYGNPPPYSANPNQHPGQQGNPPPYSAYPQGHGPPPYNHGFNNNNNQNGYYPQPSYNNNYQKGGGFGGMGGFGGYGGNRGFGGGMSKPRGFGAGFGAGFLTTAVSGLLIWSLMRSGSSHRYGVYNHYNRPDETMEEIKLPANLITLCDDNVGALCAENTTPLCTSNDTILCVVTMTKTQPCADGSCVSTVETCSNCTDDKAASNETLSLPCIANATVFGNFNPAGPTVPVNASLSVFDQNSNTTTYCVTTMAMPYTEPIVFPTDFPLDNSTSFLMDGSTDNVTTVTTVTTIQTTQM